MVGMTVSEYIRKCIKNVTLLALSQEEKAELRTIRRDIALTGNLLKQRNTAYYNLLNKLSEVDKSIAKSMVIQVKQRQDDVLHKQLENFASLKNLLIEVLKKQKVNKHEFCRLQCCQKGLSVCKRLSRREE